MWPFTARPEPVLPVNPYFEMLREENKCKALDTIHNKIKIGDRYTYCGRMVYVLKISVVEKGMRFEPCVKVAWWDKEDKLIEADMEEYRINAMLIENENKPLWRPKHD